jgi:hypothetical protein
MDIKISKNINLNNNLILPDYFQKYYEKLNKLEEYIYYKDIPKYNLYIYKYIFSKEVFHRSVKKIVDKPFLKYNAITRDFFKYNEIFNKYDIKINSNTKISIFTTYFDIIEYLFYLDIDFNTNINVLLLSITDSNFKNFKYNYKQIFKTLINLNILEPKINSIYDYLKLDLIKTDFYYYKKFDFDNKLYAVESYFNDINILIGFILGLKSLNKNGDMILYVGAINTITIADIYVLASKCFNEYYITDTEISNKLKPYSIYYIFKGFKGLTEIINNQLTKLVKQLQTKFPNYVAKFTINNDNIRKYKYLEYDNKKKILKANITKSKNTSIEYINGFLNNTNEKDYKDILDFNSNNYLVRLSELNKIYSLIESKTFAQLTKEQQLPTKEQIIASILYCRKWGIEYFPYYDKQFNKIEMNEEILNEMYGLLQPLKLVYKTPATFKRIEFTKKNLSEITGIIKHTLKTKKLRSSLRSKTRGIDTDAKNKIKTNNRGKQTMVLDLDLLLRNVDTLEDVVFEVNKRNYGADETELANKLENTNLRMHQIMLAIDSRRDFSIIDRRKQLEKYYKGNVAFRYFKHSGRKGKQDAAMYIRDKLKNNNITQAWLKMYEILSDCSIINPRLTQLNSFHLCEAPGSFIDATNNFIHTKTDIKRFNWYAQSLNVKNAMINDQLGIVKRNRNRWDWGANNTGDITNLENIRYYALKYGSQKQKLHLVTSDCGIPMGKPGYYHIAFSSLLTMMYILSESGSLVYKVLTPIQSPLIWNLIYLCYEYFEELIFFKPVQNAQSREFYIVGKGYNKTPELVKLLELLFKYVEKYDEKADIFSNKYPTPFVSQTKKFMDNLGEVFIKAIEKQLYYTDNLDDLSPKFRKMANDYLYEKIEDWISIYNPLAIKNNL